MGSLHPVSKAFVEEEIMMTENERMQLYWEAIQAWMEMDKQAKIRRFRELNDFAVKGSTVFAGSSLMEQFPINEFLMDYGLNRIIYNRGVGGFTTQELLDHMDACIFDLEPREIFLNIGTNDMNGPDYDLSEFLDRYERMIRMILQRLPGVKLFLMAFYPVNQAAAPDPNTGEAFRFRTNERILEANEQIERLAGRYHLKYLNLNAQITDTDGNLKAEYTVDGVHMHAEGYRVIFEQMLPLLRTGI